MQFRKSEEKRNCDLFALHAKDRCFKSEKVDPTIATLEADVFETNSSSSGKRKLAHLNNGSSSASQSKMIKKSSDIRTKEKSLPPSIVIDSDSDDDFT